MSAAFLEALRAEIAELNQALSSDIRYARLREAEQLARLYETTEAHEAGLVLGRAVGAIAEASSGFVSGLNSSQVSRRTSPERARALEAARMYVANRKGPVPTADIYGHIISLDIPIGGKEPVNNLSAMLSNSDMFRSNGRSGWTIKNSNSEQIEELEDEKSKLEAANKQLMSKYSENEIVHDTDIDDYEANKRRISDISDNLSELRGKIELFG